MKKQKRFNKKGKIALSEIILLVVGFVAIVYSIGVVLADSELEGGGNVDALEPGVHHHGVRAPSSTGSTPAPANGPAPPTPPIVPGTPPVEPGFDWKGLGTNLLHALAVGGAVALIAGFVLDGENAGTAGFIAGVSGTIVYKIAMKKLVEAEVGSWTQGKALALGAGVGILVFILIYKDQSQEIVSYTCYPWDAPVGGQNCQKCNEGGLPCSEYQCRSLGQACQLLNSEEDGAKLCTWVHPHDVNPPIMEPWETALTLGYVYTPTGQKNPADRGVVIENTDQDSLPDKCVKAFTPLSFGVALDEPGRCKLDYIRRRNFSDMSFYFGGSSTFKYNHTQVMSLPGPSALAAQNATIQNDGSFEMYTKCMDANGNENTGNFVFKFCVDKGPDTTPPLIVTTNVLNGGPVSFNQSSLDLIVYVNEPAECKWSHRDQTYDEMEEEMSCSTSITEMNAQMLYECSTTLNGIRNRVENDFYFRCKDQPIGVEEGDRNSNKESYHYVVVGTQPLVIDSVGPNETIKDATDSIKITLTAKTSAGYKEGKAICSYSDTGEENDYIQFFETDSHIHSQDLYLTEGDYEYFFKCEDLGNNADYDSTTFSVETDNEAPGAARVFRDGAYLTVITDEEAECVYDNSECNYLFNDGIKMSTFDDLTHTTDWNTNLNFYIKCRDEFGNEPLPNACSIITRPLEISSQSD